ncbi:MAG TPA: lysoplasmalogenase [Kofleriaceae bacterium]|nr:lysoplasmalogenase [Kofleriaceae bacterium]
MNLEIGVALSVACAVLVGGLVACEAAGSERGKRMTKPAASVMFVAVAVAGGALASDYGLWILIGLVLGAAGDVALLGSSRARFLLGLTLFLVGHIAYVIAFAATAPPKTWLAPISIVPIVAVAAILASLWRYLGSMCLPVIAYVVTIAVMLVAAIAASGNGQRGLLGVCGAVLFAASDVAVARDRFISPAVINRAWGLPAYYAGQLLMAWSVFR